MIFKLLTQFLTGCGLTVVYCDLLALSVCYCKLSGNQKNNKFQTFIPIVFPHLTSPPSAIRMLTFVAFNLCGHFSLLISL